MSRVKKYLYLIAFKLMATLPVMAVVCPICGQEGHDHDYCPQNPNVICPYCYVSMQGGCHQPDCPNNDLCPHCHVSGPHMPGCPNNDLYPHCALMGGDHRPDCPNANY
jgi:hypothetical protein